MSTVNRWLWIVGLGVLLNGCFNPLTIGSNSSSCERGGDDYSTAGGMW